MARTARRDWGRAGSMMSRCPSLRITASSPKPVRPAFAKAMSGAEAEAEVVLRVASVEAWRSAALPPSRGPRDTRVAACPVPSPARGEGKDNAPWKYFLFRHSEANARLRASSTRCGPKQSRAGERKTLDCFTALAMTRTPVMHRHCKALLRAEAIQAEQDSGLRRGACHRASHFGE